MIKIICPDCQKEVELPSYFGKCGCNYKPENYMINYNLGKNNINLIKD